MMLTINEAARVAGLNAGTLRNEHKPDKITANGRYLYDRMRMLKLARENARARHNSDNPAYLSDDELMETFCTVVNCASGVAAANKLFISTSAIYYRLRQLENRLGYKLFYGHGYSRLTPDGKRLMEGEL